MSIPTFNSTALVSRSARDLPGSPQVRVRPESLPGVDGQFVQCHGLASREIVMRGVLQAVGDTPSLAHQALKEALRTKQALADGATVGLYVGADEAEYDNSLLQSYQATDAVHVAPASTGYQAFVFVEARILHLTP